MKECTSGFKQKKKNFLFFQSLAGSGDNHVNINAGAASVVTIKRPLEAVSQDGDSAGAENDAKKPKMEEEEHVSN